MDWFSLILGFLIGLGTALFLGRPDIRDKRDW